MGVHLLGVVRWSSRANSQTLSYDFLHYSISGRDSALALLVDGRLLVHRNFWHGECEVLLDSAKFP